MTELIYTEEQQVAIEKGINALRSGTPLFRIGGAAGTGKSTIMKAIISEIDGIAVAAYTGKAASVLKGKGIYATTIHRRIYRWIEEFQEFQKIDSVDYNGFAIDEASMVGGDIFNDLQSYYIPILAIGDHHQLEPVSSKDINLMKDPDVTLETIHRQAEGNPIINLATRVRRQEPWGYQDYDERCLVLKSSAFWSDILWADVVLCGYNRTRVKINERIRYLKRYKGILEEGEKIICLQNDRGLGIFNGLGFLVTKIFNQTSDSITASLVADDGSIFPKMKIWTGAFGKEKLPDWRRTRRFQGKMMVAEYGNGLTGHKSQGSEWDKVAIIDEQCDLWSPVRWRYTTLTRASKYVRFYWSPKL